MGWDTLLSTLTLQNTLSAAQIADHQYQQHWFALTELSLLCIEGEDTYDFLQGQVTCDCRQLQQGTALLGAHLNLKGRIEASFIAFPLSDSSVLLLLPKAQAAHLQQLLTKYIAFAKAAFSPINEPLLPFLYCGAEMPTTCDYKAIYQCDPLPQLHIGLSNQQQLTDWVNASNEVTLASNTLAEAILARNGLHLINADQQGQYLPQELNYDVIQGVSFNKGCYKGQEVVARIHFKGTVKQRLTPYINTSSDTPLPEKISNTTPINHIQLPQGGSIGACLQKIAAIPQPTDGSAAQNDADEFQLLALPYAIT